MGVKNFFESKFNSMDIGNLKLEVSFSDLVAFADYLRSEQEVNSPQQIQPLLTQEEVSSILKVDSTTLWRWRSRQYLNAIKIGGKIRYRQEDIAALINEEGGADL